MPWLTILKIGAPILGILAVVLIVVAHFKADAKMERQRDEWRSSSQRWEASSKGWERGFKAVRKLRAEEWRAAKDTAQTASDTCAARVAGAQRSSRTITRILERPSKVDPVTQCPVPEPVTALELREALEP